jgi:4'-phosphopantetheinyl transferase
MRLTPSIVCETFSPKLSLKHACHLWWLDLPLLTEALILQQQGLLSHEERVRAQLFKLKERQLHFIALRAFVRLCLARYTQTAAEDLPLATEPKGKPYLIRASSPITFNLSHSHDVAVLAIGLQHAVGVDIETLTRKRSMQEIAKRYFHPSEVAHLTSLSDAAQSRYFFQLWTLKEAFLKATGDGIAGGLDKTAFRLLGDSIYVTFAAELRTQAENWQFYQQFIDDDYSVALARNASEPITVHWFNGITLF